MVLTYYSMDTVKKSKPRANQKPKLFWVSTDEDAQIMARVEEFEQMFAQGAGLRANGSFSSFARYMLLNAAIPSVQQKTEAAA